jgi:hypothetical protein
MIRLSPEDITEFQALFQKETGKEITTEQAAEYAERLVRLVGWVTGCTRDSLTDPQ